MAYTGWGTALLELGQVNDAINKLKYAIQLNPGSDDPYYRLAKAYNSAGNYAAALTAAEKAIQIKRQNAAAYIEKGNALEGMGKKAEAKEAFLLAAQKDKRWNDWVNHHIDQMK